MQSATEYLRDALADGQPHPIRDMAADLGVKPNAIQQAAHRLSRRGIPVVEVEGCYVLYAEHRCLACGRPISRYTRTGLCDEHRSVPKRRHQQMVLTV